MFNNIFYRKRLHTMQPKKEGNQDANHSFWGFRRNTLRASFRHVGRKHATCTEHGRNMYEANTEKAASNICRPRVSNLKEKDMKDEPALRTAPAGCGGPHLWRGAFSACHGTKNGARNKKPPSRRQKQDARQGSTAARPQGHFAKRL